MGLAFLLRVVIDDGIARTLEEEAVLRNPDRADPDGQARFEEWEDPREDEAATAEMYLFNLTNPAEALAGARPVYAEVGPYVYTVTTKRFDAVFSDGDDQVAYHTQTVYDFDAAASAPLAEDDELTQAWVSFQDLVRLTNATDDAGVRRYAAGPALALAWDAFVSDACGGPTDDCWELAYREWGAGDSGADADAVAAVRASGASYAAAFPGSPYAPERAAWLMRGPRGLLLTDDAGEFRRGYPWAYQLLEGAAANRTWARETWEVADDAELDRLLAYLGGVEAGLVAGLLAQAKAAGKALGDGGTGLVTRRTAREFLFNFEDPLAALLGLSANAGYFTDQRERRGEGPFAAESAGKTSVRTGKAAHAEAREVVGYAGELGSLPSQAEVAGQPGRKGYYCEDALPLSGKAADQVFLGGSLFADGDRRLRRESAFDVWWEPAVRAVRFAYLRDSRAEGVPTWRFGLSVADALPPPGGDGPFDGGTGTAYQGFFDVSCPAGGVPLLSSLPRYLNASLPPELAPAFDPPLGAAAEDEHLPYYEVEPRSGAAFAGAERFMLHARASFDYGAGEFVVPLVWASAGAQIPPGLASDFATAFDVRDGVFAAFLWGGFALLCAGAVGVAAVLLVARPAGRAAAAAEHSRKQERLLADPDYAWEQAHDLTPLFVSLFMHTFVFGIVAPALPVLVLDLYDDDYAKASLFLGAINGAAALMQVFSNPLMGTLSDALGRKPFMLVSAVGLAAQMYLIGINLSVASLVVATVVRGLTDCMFAIAYASISDWSLVRKYSVHFGLVGATIGVAFAFGPLVGAAFGTVDTLHLPFLFAALVETVNVAFILFAMPETLPPAEGARLRDHLDWSKASPMHNLRILKKTEVLRRSSRAFFLNIVGITVVTVWFLYTSLVLGWSVIENGLFLFTFGVLVIVAQGFLIRVVHPRWGDRKTVYRTLSVHAAGFVLFSAASSSLFLYLALVLATPGFIASPVIRGIITKEVGEAEQGRLQGALAGLQNIANVVGAVTMSVTFAYFVSDTAFVYFPGAPFMLSALVNAAALLVLHRVFRSFPDRFGREAPGGGNEQELARRSSSSSVGADGAAGAGAGAGDAAGTADHVTDKSE